MTGQESNLLNFNTKQQNLHNDHVQSHKAPLQGERPPTANSEQKDIELKFNRLRSLVVGAGIRGIVALLRHFKSVEE